MDIIKRKFHRNGHSKVDFNNFQELLKELFYQKDIRENIESDRLTMSKDEYASIRPRDEYLDEYYIW